MTGPWTIYPNQCWCGDDSSQMQAGPRTWGCLVPGLDEADFCLGDRSQHCISTSSELVHCKAAREVTPRAGQSCSDAGPNCWHGGQSCSDAGPNCSRAGQSCSDAGPNCSHAGQSCSDAGPNCSHAGQSCSDAGPNCSRCRSKLLRRRSELLACRSKLLRRRSELPRASLPRRSRLNRRPRAPWAGCSANPSTGHRLISTIPVRIEPPAPCHAPRHQAHRLRHGRHDRPRP